MGWKQCGVLHSLQAFSSKTTKFSQKKMTGKSHNKSQLWYRPKRGIQQPCGKVQKLIRAIPLSPLLEEETLLHLGQWWLVTGGEGRQQGRDRHVTEPTTSWEGASKPKRSSRFKPSA